MQANTLELKDKIKEESKNQTSVEHKNNSSVKDILHTVEENKRNSQKNLNILYPEGEKHIKNKNIYNNLNQTSNLKENSKEKEAPFNNKNHKYSKMVEFDKKRKSMNNSEIFLFKSKSIGINKDEINKFSSKDDANG